MNDFFTIENVLCFLIGSMLATCAAMLIELCKRRLDADFVRRVRRMAYLRGWRDGKDSYWRGEL